jgi:transposase
MADCKLPRAAGKLINEEKMQILSQKEEGMSTVEIAKQIGRHRADIDDLWVKWEGPLKFEIPKRKMGSGRPKMITMMLRKILNGQALKFP